MKVAVASLGIVPEALVGIRFGACSQFLVFDLDTMDYVVVSVPPRADPPERVSLAAIRAVARQDVAAVITGDIKDACRRVLEELGIEVVSGVKGMTVAEAVERYRADGLAEPAARAGPITRVAVVADGDGMDARLHDDVGECTSLVIVDPRTGGCETARVTHGGPTHRVNLDGVRRIVKSGASAVVAARISPTCALALQALSVPAFVAPAGITVREAVDRFERGGLAEAGPVY